MFANPAVRFAPPSDTLDTALVSEATRAPAASHCAARTISYTSAPESWMSPHLPVSGPVTATMKILVIDDHPLIREALRHVLVQLDASLDLLEAEECETGMGLAEAHPDLDLVLLDLSLPGTHDLSALELFRQSFPAIPVVVVSARDEHDLVLGALDAGAMGFIPKTSSNALMINALRLVLSGGVYVPPQALPGGEGAAPAQAAPLPQTLLQAPAQSGVSADELGLTERQRDVLELVLQGLPNKLICRQLNLAEGTVKIHVTAILKALNVTNRTQAVLAASRLGLRLRPIGQPAKN